MNKRLIRLPWPPSKLSANGPQGDWRGKSSAAKKYKDDCAKECWAQLVEKMEADAVGVTLSFHAPSNRAYDLDNALKKAKQGLDAVAEAIGVDDSKWNPIILRRGDKVKGGCILVEIYSGD